MNNSDKLYFFSKSANKPVGKGVNEYVQDNNKYTALASIDNWRKKLSNFYISPFQYDDLHWNSVEHMFQSYKIRIVNPQLAYQFCLESNSELSRRDGSEARKNRKLVMLNAQQLQEWESIKNNVMYDALRSRFTQDRDSRELLLATRDAELWHGTRGVSPQRQYILERVRREL